MPLYKITYRRREPSFTPDGLGEPQTSTIEAPDESTAQTEGAALYGVLSRGGTLTVELAESTPLVPVPEQVVENQTENAAPAIALPSHINPLPTATESRSAPAIGGVN